MPHDAVSAAPVRAGLDELARRDAPRRLHERDATLFGGDAERQASVEQRLGWLDCVDPPADWGPRLRAAADSARADGLTEIVLLGMGGSSLAPEVLARVGGTGPGGLSLTVCDSTHPDAVAADLDRDLSRALVIVASKSGTTPETASMAALAAERVPGPRHLVALTDAGTPLAAQARDEGWRELMLNPADIGGRFSALSLVGMLPAALLGQPIDRLWASAQRMSVASSPGRAIHEDPAAQLGAFIGGHARTGRDKLTLLAHAELEPLGDWVEQLVAESTGKDGRGVVPVVGEPAGEPGVYGDDRAFVELRSAGTRAPGAEALAAAGHPVLTLDVDEPLELGGAFLQWELATAYAGLLLDINPFDEPDVNATKAHTSALLDDLAPGDRPPDPSDEDPGSLLSGLTAGDYLAVHAYVPRTAAHAAALAELRAAVRDARGVATTAGFGPRFLHSTGQLHKGGPDSVAVLRLADAPEGGPPIPGKPYDFATLIRAQAAGDLRALQGRGRRVAPMRVDDGLDAAVQRVRAALG